MNLQKDEALALLQKAERARSKAYCPYSKISVGAALLTKSGKVYEGANIENAAASPGICAERAAIFAAILDGERDFSHIAVSGGNEGDTSKDEFTPCGVCRQVMAEFCRGELEVITKNGEGAKVYLLSELLPHSFGKELL